MSIVDKKTYQCPQCGADIEIKIWTVLNADVTPAAAEELIRGEIFGANCPVCGQHIEILYPFLLHDMSHKTLVYYLPEDKSIDNAESFFATWRKNIRLGEYRYRVVRTHKQLYEKAAILHKGMDDRLVEIFKCLMSASGEQEHPGIYAGECYASFPEGRIALTFLYSGQTLHSLSEIGEMTRILPVFAKNIDATPIIDYAVDRTWAEHVLNRT